MDHKAITSQPGRKAWHSLVLEEANRQDGIVARAETGKGSPWFAGHFPGEPILPGIAQLHMVFEAVQKAGGIKLKLKGLKRVRFKKVIQPEDEIKIVTGPLENNPFAFSFRIVVGDELASNGILITERLSA